MTNVLYSTVHFSEDFAIENKMQFPYSTCPGNAINACHLNQGRLHRSVFHKLQIMKFLTSDEAEIYLCEAEISKHHCPFNNLRDMDNHDLYASLLSFKPKFRNKYRKNQNKSHQSCSQIHLVMDKAFL